MEALNLLDATITTGVLAYIGPGPGLSMLGALLGLLGTVLVAILAVFSSPLRVLYRKMRGKGDEEAEADEEADEKADEKAADGDPEDA